MAGKNKSEASSSRRSSNSNNTNLERDQSKVLDWGRHKSSCGYCNSRVRTSIAHGLRALSLTVNDYQDLLDQGWRRSGSFLYKPEMERTCCPSYTIRLKVDDFVPSKEQHRVTRRMQRFLNGAVDCRSSSLSKKDQNTSAETCSRMSWGILSSTMGEVLSSNIEKKNGMENIMLNLSDGIDNVVQTCVDNGEFPKGIQLSKASVKKVSLAKRKLSVQGSEDLIYTSNIAFQLAAAIKRALPDKKEDHQSRESGQVVDENVLSPKTIAEKLASSVSQLAETFGLLVKACNGHINFYSTTKRASSDRSTEITSISEGSSAGCENKAHCINYSSECPPVKKRRLEVHLKRSSFDPEEYALYRRYQIKVHNDTPDHVTESSYRMFLVDTPLIYVPPTNDGTVPPCGFGSFHQQYVIDGKLVAVGVIDILPRCLSSKYLFWDPDFAFLSLGKYSALQEINWVKEIQIHCPSLQYYYLGYYIHSCNKMRYKAAYRPSELLCPLRYEWVPFQAAKPLLDRKSYAVLSDYATFQGGDSTLPNVSEHVMEMQQDNDMNEGDCNDVFMHEDEGADEPEYESCDDESGRESSSSASAQIENGDINDIVIELKGTCLRYKELQRAFDPTERIYLENPLRRYMRVVGPELSKRMIYSLDDMIL